MSLFGSAAEVVGQAAMLARLTRDLPGFLRTPITLEQAAQTVRQRLETRPERFLRLVERGIYGNPRSPYLRLLRSVGCEPGDLRSLVADDGLEGALARLADQGVCISFDEFKARREIVRGSERFSIAEEDFDNPDIVPHLEGRTGGSRSRGTRIKLSLPLLAELAPSHALLLLAHGLAEAEHCFWMTAPIRDILIYSKLRRPPSAWFHPLDPLPWKVRVAARYLRSASRLVGCPVPAPVWLDLKEPSRLVDWLAKRRAPGRVLFVTTYTSAAVRLAFAARERGVSLDGVCLVTMGEPLTQAKLDTILEVGARAVNRYGFQEAGGFVAGTCADSSSAEDFHFFADRLALIQRPRTVGADGLAVEAFLFTSLLPLAPKILLNVEIGDHGTVARRECGCAMGALGLRDHLLQVRSHEKLTSEGMTFVKTRLEQVVEEFLPERFGGTSSDYQLLQEEGREGIVRLFLLVSPRIGPLDVEKVRQAFLAELGRGSELEGFMAKMWQRAGTVEVRREEPRTTITGKVWPFHLTKERVP